MSEGLWTDWRGGMRQLGDNKLETLPAEIGGLKALEKLLVS